MATLVLTTVGRVFGGPIGGAIGALAGQAIDGRLFRGAAREGPRLTELAVQTSSYGTPLPRLFGTIRVAGTVIWSTDLIETRTTSRAGKGQPGTNSYSYSASFAVALSARPILAVRRIWAEGKLLRGAAGDWKGQTGFRLHRGGEDQPVDPLIASAMGPTPAYRGLAYAVFEGMQLADYGNRIPSLTFEVEADAGPVASGTVAAALAPEVTGSGGMMLEGFAATGASVRGVLDTLGVIDGGWWQADGGRLARRGEAEPPVRIADAGYGARRPGERRRRTVSAIDTCPREVAVAHHDPARDYQLGVQRARRPGPGQRIDRVELPAVLQAAAAKGIAAALVARGATERVRRRVALGVEGLGIVPGATVTIGDEPQRWRVAGSSIEAMVTTLDLVPVTAPPQPVPASSGAVVAAADVTSGLTQPVAFELPPLDDAIRTAVRVAVVANGAGAGWRGATLLYSLDEGASWTPAGGTAAPGTLGRAIVPPEAGTPWLVDRRSRMVIALDRPDMALHDADAEGLARGDNLAMVGGELLQFARARPLGDGRWLVSDLYRGLRGTEPAMAGHGVGDRFALIEREAVAVIDLPVSAIGRRLRLMASGVGDGDTPAEAAVVVTGISVAPPAPVELVAEPDGSGGLTLGWTRRSRAGWSWLDGIDAPLAEEAEAYQVTVEDADGRRRTLETQRPGLHIAAAERIAGRTTVTVVQRGTYALSAPAILIIEGE